jgi:pantetheine-phosphate adenylyltransferase
MCLSWSPVASHRAAHSLPPLETYIIDVISPSEASLDDKDIEMLKKTKMSSTFIREWIVKGGRPRAK